MNKKFNIGDLITAYPNVGYAITNHNSVCKVIGCNEEAWDDIRVKVIKHKNPYHVGDEYVISSDGFYLVKSAIEFKLDVWEEFMK